MHPTGTGLSDIDKNGDADHLVMRRGDLCGQVSSDLFQVKANPVTARGGP
jgi:hypothetical protein